MTSRLRPMSALSVSRLSESAFVGGAPGLQLAVSPKGTRTWRLYYRLPGDARRRVMNLGRFPDVSLSEARQRAGRHLSEASDGADPKNLRIAKAAGTSLTAAEAVEAYLTSCAAENAARTVEAKESALRCHFLRDFGRRPIAQISRGDMARLLDTLVDRPALRRNLYAYLRHFFSWCADRELVTEHPVLLLRAPKPVAARERVLSDDEIRSVWALDGVMGTIAKLALLTAQRKGSIEQARWADLDLASAVWTIPAANMKSGRAHTVPLSRRTIQLLEAWPKFGGPFLFGIGSGGALPFNGASNGIESLRRATGTHDWRLHDLRRTAVTLAQRSGCPVVEIRALTQHKIPGVIGVYARHSFEAEKRAVVSGISSALDRVIGPQPRE